MHVLLEVNGEHEVDLARDLARFGGDVVEAIRHHQQVAPAVTRMLP